jgi:hypothetical protein
MSVKPLSGTVLIPEFSSGYEDIFRIAVTWHCNGNHHAHDLQVSCSNPIMVFHILNQWVNSYLRSMDLKERLQEIPLSPYPLFLLIPTLEAMFLTFQLLEGI